MARASRGGTKFPATNQLARGREGRKKKGKKKKKKKAARHHERAWPSSSSSSSASFLPPAPLPAPPRLSPRLRREPGPRRDSPPSALTPRIPAAGRGSPGGRGAQSPAPPAAERAAPLKYLRARLRQPHSSPSGEPTGATLSQRRDLRARVPPPRSTDRAAPCLRTCYRRR